MDVFINSLVLSRSGLSKQAVVRKVKAVKIHELYKLITIPTKPTPGQLPNVNENAFFTLSLYILWQYLNKNNKINCVFHIHFLNHRDTILLSWHWTKVSPQWNLFNWQIVPRHQPTRVTYQLSLLVGDWQIQRTVNYIDKRLYLTAVK